MAELPGAVQKLVMGGGMTAAVLERWVGFGVVWFVQLSISIC